MNKQHPLTTPGTFLVGSNYLGSHAGTAMWSDWQPDVVAQDFKRFADAGLQLIRVFPMWPDFQPLSVLHDMEGPVEYRHGEEPLPDDEAGQAGVSREAMAHFAELADIAHQNGLKLLVALMNGWMSGRQFVPPVLEGRNPLTSSMALMWETRFVRHFVRTFRNHPAITAWDPGNECNCMGKADRHQAWVWTSTIANAIRAEDQVHPIVSGMHGLTPAFEGPWRIQDQGEITDVLITHPYPYFTPYCDQDPVNTIRPLLHSAAESRMHSDIGGKPCLVEEINVLGPFFATERIAADFIRTVLFSAWAHDCHGVLWWCGVDFSHLSHAPYDWWAFERELGLFRRDGTPRPVLNELKRFRRFLRELPIEQLPQRATEAVCILSIGQDHWAAAFSSFILAKQAGFDLQFQYADQPLKEANFYLLPSVSTARVIPRRRWLELLERVKSGATLYVSHDDGMLYPFTEPFGLEVLARERRGDTFEVVADGLPGKPRFAMRRPFRLRLQPTRAEVLGREADGNPVFARTRYGKGTLYFLSFPMEKVLATTPGVFHEPSAPPCRQVYQYMAEPFLSNRAVTKDHPQVGITEHALDDRKRLVILINYSPEPVTTALTVSDGWKLGDAWYGSGPNSQVGGSSCSIPPNDAAVFTVGRV